jgi:hypothetical protein
MKFVCVVLLLAACRGGSTQTYSVPGDRGHAITVEVLNASGRPGGARIATRILRRAGIDVVFYGNAAEGGTALDSTRIIVRRGDAKVGERVRAVLGAGKVEVQLDSGKLLDVSVLLGADFTAFDLHP